MDPPLDRLQKLLDLLGPGLFLEMDKAAFSIFFDGNIGLKTAEIEAKRFAMSRGCCFFSNGDKVKFGRAYPKLDGDGL